LDIKGQHPTNWIVTKCLKRNIITTLCGANTSKIKEGRNDDDYDIDTRTFLMRPLRPQMIVITMNLNPNIQILPLVILLGHKS
jgi:hypothetical protein